MWSSSKQVLNNDFIRTSKAKGNTKIQTAIVHVLKNALVPIVSNLNAICLTLLTVSLIVENAFHLNGLGSLLIKIVIERDFNTLIFVNILIAGFLLLVRFISELIISQLDPRVDLGWGQR
jgi:ABC-type dipeptide/oligopeptide/nickel transport system permease component